MGKGAKIGRKRRKNVLQLNGRDSYIMTRPLDFALKLEFEPALIFDHSGEGNSQSGESKKIPLNVQNVLLIVAIYTYT